jgi:hypothetical protein
MNMTKEAFHGMYIEDLELIKKSLLGSIQDAQLGREKRNMLLEVLGVMEAKKMQGMTFPLPA